MNYKKIALLSCTLGTMFIYGCKNGDLGEDFSKDSTVPQGEVVTQADEDTPSFNAFKEELESQDESIYNYKIVTEKYTNGKINIEYPQIIGINSVQIEEVNKYIRDLAHNTESNKEINSQVDTWEEKFEVKSQSDSFVSILVTSYGSNAGSAHPYKEIKTYNVNLLDGTIQRLVDTGRTAELASKIFNGQGYTIKGEDAMKVELEGEESTFGTGSDLLYRKGYGGKTELQIKQMLDDFDIDTNNTEHRPIGYTYYENDKIVLCMEVSHALGDYLELTFE